MLQKRLSVPTLFFCFRTISGTTRSVAWVRREGWSTTGGLGDRRGGEPAAGDEDRSLAIAGSEEDVLVVMAGGPAGAFIHALLPFAGAQVSRRIEAD